jgi:tRNA threonylcarbamoyladenosine biosynthesis protein TsaB
MRILALDTSTLVQTVCVWIDGERIERTFDARPTHSRRLVGTIRDALCEAGVEPGEVDLVTVGIGPGSFTGLRIGVASAKAFAFATGCPIVGVGSLDALAFTRSRAARGRAVVAANDARRGEVYAGAWQLGGEDAAIEPLLNVDAYRPGELADALGAIEGDLLGLGTGFTLYRDALASRLGARLEIAQGEESWPRAWAVAELGRRRYDESGADDVTAVEPRYIRLSDAEINWRRQEKQRR